MSDSVDRESPCVTGRGDGRATSAATESLPNAERQHAEDDPGADQVPDDDEGLGRTGERSGANDLAKGGDAEDHREEGEQPAPHSPDEPTLRRDRDRAREDDEGDQRRRDRRALGYEILGDACRIADPPELVWEAPDNAVHPQRRWHQDTTLDMRAKPRLLTVPATTITGQRGPDCGGFIVRLARAGIRISLDSGTF